MLVDAVLDEADDHHRNSADDGTREALQDDLLGEPRFVQAAGPCRKIVF
jgi:hypothetical protein